MRLSKMNITTAIIIGLIILIAFPALAGSRKRGDTYTTESIQISNIESKALKDDSIGNTWYTFRAKMTNRTNQGHYISTCIQAVDRQGFEITEVCFFKKPLKKRASVILSDKRAIDADQYQNIWQWQVNTVDFD